MHDRRFNPSEISRLRSPERLARMEVARVVQEALRGIQAASMLDVGTGSGVFAEAFFNQGLAVHGVDVSADMVAAAQRILPDGKFQASPAELLPFSARAFDLVFMGMVLHETDDPLQALREAYRCSQLRVAVLEWPDEDQEFGPPRADRLPASKIQSMAQQAGFIQIESIRLTNLVLYLLKKNN